MNCDQVKGLLVEYLLDELSEEEKSAIELHLSHGCSSCSAYERELAEGINILFDAIPDDPLSSQQREAILASATSRQPDVAQTHRLYQVPDYEKSYRLTQILPYLLAVAAGLWVMMTLVPIRSSTRNTDNVVHEDKDVRRGAFAVDPKTITHDSVISEEKYSKTRLVSMQRTNAASKIEGRILWDALNHEVHFFGVGIPTPPKGKHYVLWLMGDDDRTLVTKKLNVDSAGKCKVTATSSMEHIIHVFITMESNTGPFDRPSQNVELTLDAKRLNPFPDF